MSLLDDKNKIFEDGNEQHHLGFSDYDDLMTDEQKERGTYYAAQYALRRSEVDRLSEDSDFALSWDEIEKAYQCKRDLDTEDDSAPNNFLPLLTPTVEGQVAHMSSADTEYIFVSDNPAHEKFMRKLKAGFFYNKKMSRFDAHAKDGDRSYLLLGGAWGTVAWAKARGRSGGDKPDGYAKISVLPIRSVLVDGRIKDFKDLQEAEYIIREVGFVPISWIRKEYGDDYADGVQAGLHRIESNGTTMDDFKSAMLLHVWTRNNEQGNLQLIVMDSAGLIIEESDSSKPYYANVDNEYPFVFARGMPIQGSFYGFGDGKILLRFQKIVNKLADELEYAARFSAQAKTYLDPRGEVNLDEIDSDPSHPILCKNPGQNILVKQGSGINQVVMESIQMYIAQAQTATRFSDIMMGAKQMASTTATATQNQVLQGAIGINDKKADMSAWRAWLATYSMKLCLEFWLAPFWSKIEADKDSEMVDMPMLGKVPASIPATFKTIESTQSQNPNIKFIPKFESVKDKNGVEVQCDIDFSVSCQMGAGMPKDDTSRFNYASLAAQQVMADSNGVPRNVLNLEQYRTILSRILGMEIEDDQERAPALPPNGMTNPVSDSGGVMPPQGSQLPSNMASTVPGVTGQDKRGLTL